MVNILMCYSNSTIVNIYWHCRKLVYKIIVNRGGYKITYFVASYRVYSPIYGGAPCYNIFLRFYSLFLQNTEHEECFGQKPITHKKKHLIREPQTVRI
jgi:hypothetical protein